MTTGTIGTPISGGTTVSPGNSVSAISLVRYAQRIGYRECAFFGINHPDNIQWECRAVWSQSQRDMIAWVLAEAQDELEQEIGYFLVPRWVTAERHPYTRPLLTRWGHVIAGGVMLDTVIQAGAAVSYAADPATIIVAGVTCATADIHVYHAGTDQEILPSAMTLVSGTLTISMPWCRLVAPAYQDNPETGWLYASVATWGAATVDVHCITNDESTQAHLITGPHHCGCSTTGCTETEHDACMYVRLPEIGSVEAHHATYADGAWTRTHPCTHAQWVELNYLSGLTALTKQGEDSVIRLGHSKMSSQPCGCDGANLLWTRDRNVPSILTRERINNPFGLSDGAWTAWRFAESMKLVRGAIL